MELKQIKELMAAMGRTGTKKLSLKKEGFEIQLEREENSTYKMVDMSLEVPEENTLRHDIEQHRANISVARQGEKRIAPQPEQHKEMEKEDSHASYVASPMVGTFYSSPSPDDPAFIKVGDKVEKNTVVCIIEAMKVMNEVKAGISGTVAEILIETGHPVEFGTKLIKIV